MALTPNTALVYDAHEYSPVSPDVDPHGHADDCPCSPVCECGSAADAYIHSQEAIVGGATVVQRTHMDAGLGAESTNLRDRDSFALGGNGKALIVPGRDTREGTDAYTQEPGTVAERLDTPMPTPVVAQEGPTPGAAPAPAPAVTPTPTEEPG